MIKPILKPLFWVDLPDKPLPPEFWEEARGELRSLFVAIAEKTGNTELACKAFVGAFKGAVQRRNKRILE